jgi:hypothetical protein
MAVGNEIMSQLLSMVEGLASRHAGHSGFIHAVFGFKNTTAEGNNVDNCSHSIASVMHGVAVFPNVLSRYPKSMEI